MAVDIGHDLVGQAVEDPDEPRGRLAIGRYLHRRAVLFYPLADNGIDQPPPRLVAIDQQLARHRAVGKGHDPRVAIKPRIEHESRHQPWCGLPKSRTAVQTSAAEASIGMSLWMEAMVV